MDLDELFKEIPSNTVDDPPMNVANASSKDAGGDTPQKKNATTVPSTSTVPLNLFTTSTSMGTNATATMSLNTETSSNATRKLHNNIYYIICYLYLYLCYLYFF